MKSEILFSQIEGINLKKYKNKSALGCVLATYVTAILHNDRGRYKLSYIYSSLSKIRLIK